MTLARFLAVGCPLAITVLQTGAAGAWLLQGDWRQFLFWLGLAICNGAYVLMITK